MLTNDIVKAINEQDIIKGKDLIKICDRIHKSGKGWKGYKAEELPTDEKYEELKRMVEGFGNVELNAGLKTSDHAQYVRKDNKGTSIVDYSALKRNDSNKIVDKPGSAIIMDGIVLPKSGIPTIKNAIIMPKYDGCAVGLHIEHKGLNWVLTKAHTRGLDSLNGDRKSSDITDKIKLIFDPEPHLRKLLTQETIKIKAKDKKILGNTNDPIEVEFNPIDITEIRLRAEVVKINKDSSETATGWVAGAINGYLETFKEKMHNIQVVPFEIVCIITTNDIIVPTQKYTLELLSMMELLKFDYEEVKLLDSKFDFIDMLDDFQDTMKEPLDGLVYCSENWTYPQHKDENSKHIEYNKFKFKRNNIAQTEITGVEYSIGSTGKLTPTLLYKPVKIGEKTYKQAKMAVGRLEKLTGLGVGCICDVELKADINPMVVKVYPDVSNIIYRIDIIKHCPYCNSKLIRKETKEDVVISCSNENCKGLLRKQLEKFLKAIGFKGITITTMENENTTTISELYERKIKLMKPSAVRAKKSQKMSGKDIAVKEKPNKANEFLTLMRELSIGKMLIALGICTQSTLNKYCEKNMIDKTLVFSEHFRREGFLKDIFTTKFNKSILDFYISYM